MTDAYGWRRDKKNSNVDQILAGNYNHSSAEGRMMEKTEKNNAVDRDLDKALQYHQNGSLEQAEILYRSVLEQAPEHSDAMHMLGVLACQTGNLDEGLKLLARSVTTNKDNPFFHNNYGYMLMAAGQLDLALDHLNIALSLKPDYVDVLNNLGRVYQSRGNLARATMCYRRALDLKPQFSAALNNLGSVFHARGRMSEAVTYYLQAVTVNPNFPEACNNLGAALLETGQTEQAETVLKQALAIAPQNAEVLFSLAELYEKTQRIKDAESYLEKTLVLSPRHPSANRLAAVLLRRKGLISEALDQLLDIPVPEHNPEVARNIHFELGTLYDRLNESEKAFYHFSEGNRLQNMTGQYHRADKDRYLGVVKKLSETYSREWIDSWSTPAVVETGPSPVFLMGFPCSGATLLNRILDNHPRLRVMDEKPALELVCRELNAFPERYPASLAGLNKDDIIRLRSVYFSAVKEYIGIDSNSILIDKLPLNMIRVGVIARLFPGAKIIFLVRHPLDVCLSCFIRLYKLDDASANFQTLEDTSAMYAGVMDLWQQYTSLLPLSLYVMKYENLVEDTETEVGGVLEFLDLEWDDSVLRFAVQGETQSKVNTQDYRQLTEPIYSRATNRWKRYEKYLAPVREILGPFIKRLGYGKIEEP